MNNRLLLIVGVWLSCIHHAWSGEKAIIRIGMQSTGTLEWELSALKADANKQNFQLDIHPLANTEAGKIALQSGAVDIILSD